jgi:hypothetical protein
VKVAKIRPTTVVDGGDKRVALAGTNNAVLQLRGNRKGENHTKIWSHDAQGGGSSRRSKGGSEMAKSGRDWVGSTAAAGKTESWEVERGEGVVLGKQSTMEKDDGEEGYGGFSLLWRGSTFK